MVPTSSEAVLVFNNIVHNFVILACEGSVYEIWPGIKNGFLHKNRKRTIAAHDTGCSSHDAPQERMSINFMLGPIVDIRA